VALGSAAAGWLRIQVFSHSDRTEIAEWTWPH
jgi:hypothetical protein